MNKSRLYWILQFGGWTGLSLTSLFALLMFLPFIPAFGSNVVAILFGVGISHIYRLYVKKKNWKQLKISQLVPRVFIASFIQGALLGIVTLVALILAMVFVYKNNPDSLNAFAGIPEVDGMSEEIRQKLREASFSSFSFQKFLVFILSYVVSNAIYFLSWSSLYFAYQYLQKTREMEIERWKLTATVKDAELSALKSQVNPHFIFNSLNNIRSLVVEDAEKARDSITHLSDLLRFSIQFDQFEKISLKKELEVVEDYLQLEAIQLEERLTCKYQLEPGSDDWEIPPMIIQTLVENAIKHSINNLPGGGKIVIETKSEDGMAIIYVKNSGQLKVQDKPQKRKGIGIANSRERLRLLYGKEAELRLENMNESMVCATVKLPL